MSYRAVSNSSEWRPSPLSLPVVLTALKEADIALLRLLRTRGHSPAAERAVHAFSRLGEHSAIWFATSALGTALDHDRRPVYLRLARTVIAVELANAIAKLVIGRPRPRLEGLPALMHTRSQRSFPSAHAASSFAAARVLSARFPAVPIYGVACAMGLSRPYLGVHYPSDVLAGFVFGSLIAELGPLRRSEARRGSVRWS